VPLCGGVPAASMTCAMICVVPLTASAVVDVVNVMVEPDGASSGTRWQATMGTTQAVKTPSLKRQRDRGIMNALSILIHMYLAGQGRIRRRGGESGYAMAALIVGLAVMAVMMTVAMPVWKQMAQREKEEELVFRGEQIAHSIGMFQKKYANAYPPTIDVLVEQKFLRKKYKDPIANDDFVPITQAQAGSATPGGAAGTGRAGQPQQTPTSTAGRGAPGGAGATTPGGATVGGIIGVTSKSKDVSIRLYKGRSHYNEWAFVYTPTATGAGSGTPGQQGQRGRGNQPPGSNNPQAPFPGAPGGVPGRGPGGPGAPGGRGPGGGPFPFPTGPGRGR